jgi:hypothetical protein
MIFDQLCQLFQTFFARAADVRRRTSVVVKQISDRDSIWGWENIDYMPDNDVVYPPMLRT